jgi:hypothetical protein
MLLDLGLKLPARDQLQNLAENARYSIHGGSLQGFRVWFLMETQIQTTGASASSGQPLRRGGRTANLDECGPFSPQNYYYNWQYYGYPPISRVIAETVDTDPQGPGVNSPPEHWTAGCLGTTAFLVLLLKVVNIPATGVQVGGHTAPYFMSEDLYLSHGDDPYNQLSQTGYPANYLLISHDDYQAWFGSNNIFYGNRSVGRREIDLAVYYPTSNAVLGRYCDDVLANADHASGRVYNEIFSSVYTTVSYLEVLGLWDRLEQARLTLGCPSTGTY